MGDARQPWSPASLTLVAIADTLRDGLEELVARSRGAVDSGATCVHLRLKGEDARTLVAASRALRAALAVPVIVHERVDVAVAAGAAGVHLSAEEMPPGAARSILRPGMVVGASVGGAADLDAGRAADYVSIGPIFAAGGRADPPALGVDELKRLALGAGVPAIAVGGITAGNARAVLDTGVVGVAVITGAFAKAEAAEAIRQLRGAIGT